MEANTLHTNFPEHRQVRRYRHLIKALLCSVVIHVLALVAMALILAPGLDTEAAVISRATWVAEHPYWWRLGWLPWQLTALSDLWVSAALLAYLWSVSGRPGFAYACFGMFWVIVAVIPDQWGEAVFVSHFVTLAKSTAEGDTALSTYLKVESWGLRVTGVWGAGAYVLMSMGWFMASLKSAGGVRMHRFFAVIALVTVGLFSLAAGLTWYATSHAQVEQGYPLFAYVYKLNALAFPLLLLVMMGMICVLALGHYHRLPAVDTKRHRLGFPNEGRLLRYFSSYIAGLRDCLRWLPSPHLCSDISDVVYLNWRVPMKRLQALLPSPLELHSQEGQAWLSVLIFCQGSLGPKCLGYFRRFLPSPPQCNIRVYLKTKEGEEGSVYFIKCAMGNSMMVCGSRLFADGLPLQRPSKFEITGNEEGVKVEMLSGGGNAPDLITEIAYTEVHAAQGSKYLPYLVEQNRAINVVHPLGGIFESRIKLDIDLSTVRPAVINQFECPLLQSVVEGVEPFSFVVPSVAFEARGESRVGELS